MNDKKKSYKERNGTTRVGDFLRGIKGKVLPTVLEAIGAGDFAKAIGIISKDPQNAGLTEQEAEQFFKLVELQLKDTQNAREMYSSTGHEISDYIAKRVIVYNLWVVLGAILIEIFCVKFIDDKVLIAIISGAVGGFSTALLQERQQVINFFFGSSKGSKDKQNVINSLK